jgi:hypothetical protein
MAEPIVREYTERKVLADLGYVTDTSKISAFKAECFIYVASEFAAEREKARK